MALRTVEVMPANDTIRKLIKHPVSGGFSGNNGAGHWLDDNFTWRRIADGDVTLVKPEGEHSEHAAHAADRNERKAKGT